MENDKKFIMGTYDRYNVVFERGENSTLFDANNKQYIDFSSGIGVNSIGYNDEDWTHAVINQATKLQHVSNLYHTEPQVLLAEKLTKLAGMSKVFFANSGAEANEGAIKLARKYGFDKYGKQRTNIITLVNSFHGRTITTLKATGQEKFHDFFFPFTDGFVYAKANDFHNLIEKIDDTVCAVMFESIQGEGGVLPLDEDYVRNITKYCHERDVLIIFDEVQTGIGRTGKSFGFEHYDVVPDIISVAKGLGGGLPIGGFLCNEKLEKTLSIGHHGSTFGGNPICASGALVVLDKICNEESLSEITKKGQYISNQIKDFNCSIIKEVRGKGLMIGIEIIDDDVKRIINKCLDNGLVILSAGKNTLRLLPPLTISYDDINKGLKILKNILL